MKYFNKKLIIVLLLIICFIVTTILINSVRAEDLGEEHIEILCSDEIIAGKVITVNLKLKNIKHKVETIFATIEYDTDVFEELTDEDFRPGKKWGYPGYNEENNMFYIFKSISTSKDEIFLSFDLTVKPNVTVSTSLIKITDIDVAGDGEQVFMPETSEFEIGKTISPEEPEELGILYLTSDVYKIGNKDITKYQIGDEFISRIQDQTNKKDFMNNIETNGLVKILKENNSELQENELIGTGMKLQSLFTDDREFDLGDEEDILGIFKKLDDELIETKIAVNGDLDGDGKVTATDLSALNQTLLELITLEDEYKVAGDLDENGEITATDYSTLNKMVLGIL